MTAMREKLLWATCIAVVGLVLAYGQRQPFASAPGDVGRYQLYRGPGSSGAGGNLLYRIDTRTGKTWEYLEEIGPLGAQGGYWTEIPEHQRANPQN